MVSSPRGERTRDGKIEARDRAAARARREADAAAVRGGEAARDLQAEAALGDVAGRAASVAVRIGDAGGRPGPRSRTSMRSLLGSSGCRRATSSIGAPGGETRCAFSMRLTRISSASDGSTFASGQSSSTCTVIGRDAKTSGRFSRTARKRSAGGVGSRRGFALPASSRAIDSRLSMRRRRLAGLLGDAGDGNLQLVIGARLPAQ